MAKELYQSPEIEAVLFDSEDIVTASFTDPDSDALPAAPWGN